MGDEFETEEHYKARGDMITLIFKVFRNTNITIPDGIMFKLYLYSLVQVPNKLTMKSLFNKKP